MIGMFTIYFHISKVHYFSVTDCWMWYVVWMFAAIPIYVHSLQGVPMGYVILIVMDFNLFRLYLNVSFIFLSLFTWYLLWMINWSFILRKKMVLEVEIVIPFLLHFKNKFPLYDYIGKNVSMYTVQEIISRLRTYQMLDFMIDISLFKNLRFISLSLNH